MKLIEHYLSIQGEGLHPGQLTYFVRFARCNLRCRWCDSVYTFGPGKEVPFETVVKAIRKSKARYVCLTGGEPLLHKDDCLRLIRYFPKIHFDVETGGSLDIRPYLKPNVSVIMDWKLEGSGMKHRMMKSNLPLLRPKADLLKLVTRSTAAERKEMKSFIQATHKTQVPVSIQPVHGSSAKNAAEWALSLKNPRVQLNLQLHKIVWPNKNRGV